MRVILRPPSDWSVTDVRGVATYILPRTPEIAVHVGALVVCPEDLATWRAAKLRADLPADAIATLLGESTFETATGWPASAARVRVALPDGGVDARSVAIGGGDHAGFAGGAGGNPPRGVEHRIVVAYHFLHTIAAVLVRSAAELEPRAAEIRAVLVTAQPDFRTEQPIALDEIWRAD